MPVRELPGAGGRAVTKEPADKFKEKKVKGGPKKAERLSDREKEALSRDADIEMYGADGETMHLWKE